ncbi:rhomboid family intramembrane serine protease [Bacillus sp. P14.5]|uniref:rhomboid family intramembrane serine protease n=1 Tax=Bacillus sp. P14.5 TaxID=1983400 RepID=UPI001963E641|nr:rhomboid family intramembrane serine protease [Bacillus sp. P14.5]
MNTKLNYLFWRTIHYLIVEKGYRIINMSQDQQQLWLENSSHKQAPVIRVVRDDLDWSSKLKRDVHLTALNGEKIRRALKKSKLILKNIYISAYPPVDDYEELVSSDYILPQAAKTTVQSAIITIDNVKEDINKVTGLFNEEAHWEIKEEPEEMEVHALKENVLSFDTKKAKEEKSLFTMGKPFFTYVFIALQLAVFFIMEMAGGSQNTENLIRYGAKYNPLILEGEWWRFFTPVVIHIGFLHLLMNTFALYFLGMAVERIFGSARFLFIYIFAGFTGTLASFVFTNSLSAGASGAIFGCFGALLYFGTAYPRIFFRTMGTNILVVIGINLALGFTLPGIDNAGHIGGLAGGALSAAVVHLPRAKRWGIQLGAVILAIAAIPALLWYGYQHGPILFDPSISNAEAQEMLNDGNIEGASAILVDVIEKREADAHSYFLYSIVKIKNEQYNEAETYLNEALVHDRDFPEAHYNLAVLLVERGEEEEARDHAKRAYQLQKDNNQFKELHERLQSKESP